MRITRFLRLDQIDQWSLVIPSVNMEIQIGDRISIGGNSLSNTNHQQPQVRTGQVRRVMLFGGGRLGMRDHRRRSHLLQRKHYTVCNKLYLLPLSCIRSITLSTVEQQL